MQVKMKERRDDYFSHHWEITANGDDEIVLRLTGNWCVKKRGILPTAQRWWRQNFSPSRPPVERLKILFDASLSDWDDRLVAFIHRLQNLAMDHGVDVQLCEFPEQLAKILKIARENFSKIQAVSEEKVNQLPRGHWKEPFAFIGEVAVALGRFFRKKIAVRKADYEELFFQIGIEAIPIVALISFLTGMILGFVGVIQLARFGAAIYVADLVGLSMAREMGAMMTAIVMAGRTGASFAASLGAMKVNEELDSLKTFGFSPIEFLVLPRILVTACAVPMLCIFSVFIGIGGGMAIAVPMFDISAAQYIGETISSISVADFVIGVFKGFIFAILIAGIGCWCGMRCDRSAEGVGRTTTSAVVLSITAIIVADGIFAFLCNLMQI
jgi:phospholipid/cholesterol/gamma-HCH transport system permease protein